jgi:hypothetical protein
MNFRNKLIFYGEELLTPRPTPNLEARPLSAVLDCLFSIFAATLHVWRPSPPSATWGRAMPLWQGDPPVFFTAAILKVSSCETQDFKKCPSGVNWKVAVHCLGTYVTSEYDYQCKLYCSVSQFTGLCARTACFIEGGDKNPRYSA